MPSVTIDPGVLAAPAPELGRDSVYEYVETLLDWKQLLNEEWVSIYMSERAAEVLDADNLYPLRDSLRQIMNQHGIVEYDYNTVAQIAERLLQITPHFESVFDIQEVLHEPPITEPDLLSEIVHPNLGSELARCVILFALLRNHCQNPITDHALVVRPWHGHTNVRVEAVLHEVEHCRPDLDHLPALPARIEGEVWVCQSFGEFVSGVDEVSTWQSAENNRGCQIAVLIALHKMRLERGVDPDWGDYPPFAIGSHFVTRAKECFRDNPASLIQKTLRAMVEAIDDLKLENVHSLRERDSGGSPQRTRGREKAWRRDIDREYHLHYWKGPNGIEFGWMGPHNDFELPE